MDHACHPVRYDHYVRCARRDRDRKNPATSTSAYRASCIWAALRALPAPGRMRIPPPTPTALSVSSIAMSCAISASMAGGLIYAFLTISLRANQNVTGLALTTFGMGVANFFGVFILNGASYPPPPLPTRRSAQSSRPVRSGCTGADRVLLRLFGLRGHRAGRCAALVPDPHPRGLNPRRG